MRGEGFISSLFSIECAAWQNPRMSENSAFSLSTVASTDTCRHLTKTHFQCLQQSISTAANEKGRAVLFFLYVQLTIPGTSALLPLPFYPFLAPFLWDLTTLRLWVTPNNASPLFLLSLIKILKVKFVGFFAYKTMGKAEIAQISWGFSSGRICGAQSNGVQHSCKAHTVPGHPLCCWVPPPFSIPATFLRAWTHYSKS